MPSLNNNTQVATYLKKSKVQFQIITPIYSCIFFSLIYLWPESWPSWLLGLLVTVLLAELWYVWISHRKDSGKLVLLRAGTLEWRGEWYHYTPLFANRYVAILFLRAKGRFLFLPIWKDSCPDSDYHKIHLLIRYLSFEKN